MSLSEMNKATYRKHRRLIRDNGIYAFKWIECPLERADMQEIYAYSMDSDLLAERAYMQRIESRSVAFRLTTSL